MKSDDLTKLGKYEPFSSYSNPMPGDTISVGICEWIKTSNGKGIKKSAILKRFKGYASKAPEISRHAQKYCDELNQMTSEEASEKLIS